MESRYFFSIVILSLICKEAVGFTSSSSSSNSRLVNFRFPGHKTQYLSSKLDVISDDFEIADTTEQSIIDVYPESASLLPGQILTIRIGDTSNPKKAWKKRRRSGSPILVPCTILSMNRESMIQFNLMSLLHRFGRPTTVGKNTGVVLSVGSAVKLYKYRLGGDLLEHSKALGHRTIVEFLKVTFSECIMKEHGVKLVRLGDNQELVLVSALSLSLAREAAYKGEFVQFQPSVEDGERMIHTGTAYQLFKDDEKYQTIKSSEMIHPLSAAVRISQADAESGRFHTGLECNAFVHTFDTLGDNGSPLLTCAIDPPHEQIRDRMKRRAYVKRQLDVKEGERDVSRKDDADGHDLSELHVGGGPYQATVVSVSRRAGAVFVDIGVSRKRGKKAGGGTTKVVGMLRFADIAENASSDNDGVDTKAKASLPDSLVLKDDQEATSIENIFMSDDGEEFEEDVSDSFLVNEFGELSTIDPITGQTSKLESAYPEEEEVTDVEDNNMFAGVSPEERLRIIGHMLEEQSSKDTKNMKNSKSSQENVNPENQYSVGDKLEVYIRSVSPQSGRFMVTLDSKMKGKKSKDIKKEKEAAKRIARLAKKFGGERGVQDILDSVGEEMEGVVKATSKSGDWYYVQPDKEGYPAGVARSSVVEPLKPGQQIKLRLDGMDEVRGQLALTILEKLN